LAKGPGVDFIHWKEARKDIKCSNTLSAKAKSQEIKGNTCEGVEFHIEKMVPLFKCIHNKHKQLLVEIQRHLESII